MEEFERKNHWKKIYQTKQLQEVSWFQPNPETSLSFIKELNVEKHAKIIDIGGGDSLLVDHLLDSGYQNISVLDISASALERAKLRLGERANKVTWIVADIANFKPTEQYDFWHDRAAFHFLTKAAEIESYLNTLKNGLNKNGKLVVGTFSENGPTKCSGIDIKQYSESSMSKHFNQFFKRIKCITVDYSTPFETIQNFIFCSFHNSQNIA
jgi:ubiquinone/menaquinone biosynthesis C-methylase UbiE